jgi:hypothetical protein
LGREEKLKEQVALLRRERTSHTYEEELAEQVYAALPQALARFKALLSRLEEEGF